MDDSSSNVDQNRDTHAPVDSVGSVETTGIEFIPDEERNSRPANLWWILLGGSLTFSIIVIGWVPVSLGLSWWASFSAVVAGMATGATLLITMSLFGPRCGTNTPVASGAHFGVVGRLVGSIIGALSGTIFTVLSIWTAGDTLSQSASRIAGIESPTVLTMGAYALVAIIMTAIAVLGHANMVVFQKLMVPTAGLMMIIGVFVFWPEFDAGYAGRELALGFWPTWVIGALPAAATTASYVSFLGDWTRHISRERHSERNIVIVIWLGGCFGMGAAYLFGTYTAVTFANPTASYVSELVANSPFWYLFPILFIGLVAGTAQAILCIYSVGLDFSAIFARLSRIQATLLVSVITTIVVYISVVFGDLTGFVNVALSIFIVLTSAWATVNFVGFLNRKGYYYPHDLQVFNRGEKGGRYWFTRGINLRAVVAWVLASIAGLLFVNIGFYVGPGANLLGGADIGLFVSGLLGGSIYFVLLLLTPEPRYVFGPEGALLGADDRQRQPKIEEKGGE